MDAGGVGWGYRSLGREREGLELSGELRGLLWQSWREKPRVLLRRRGWACGEVTPPSRRAQKQIAKHPACKSPQNNGEKHG